MTSPLPFTLLLVLLFNVNQFMVYPVLGAYSQKSHALSAVAITAVLSAKSLVENGLTIILSLLSFGVRPGALLVAASALRLAAMALLATSPSYPMLFVFAALIGLGGALGRPALRTAIADQAGPKRQQVFSFMHILMNAGVITGPLLAMMLVNKNLLWPLLPLCALLELLNAAVVARGLRSSAAAGRKRITLAALKQVLTPTLCRIYAGQLLFWAAIGLSITGIALIHKIHPAQVSLRGFLFSTEGLGAILWQMALMKYCPRMRAARKYAVAAVSVLLGLGLYFVGGSAVMLVSGIGLFALGDALLGPQLNVDLAAATEGDAQRNTAFAVLLTSESLGEICGNTLGGLLIDGMLGGFHG